MTKNLALIARSLFLLTAPLPFICPVSATVITENTDPNTITSGNSVACGNSTATDENTYYRAFSFSDFGISSDFNISQVEFGIEQALAGSGTTQSLTLSIYPGTDLNALSTPLASEDLTIDNQNLTLFDAAIAAAVPQGAGGFIVSIFSPSAGNKFYIGSNTAGQSAPSYIMAPACGITSPTDLADVGFPDMDIVMSVTGEIPEPTPAVLLLSGAAVFFWARARGSRAARRAS